MRTMWLAALAFAAGSGAAEAAAVTIFKYADSQGRVTYTNREPAAPIVYTTLEVETDEPPAATRPAAPAPPEPRRKTQKVSAREKPEPRTGLLRVGGLRAAAAGDAGLRWLPVVKRAPPEAAEPPLSLRLDVRLSLERR